MQVNFFKSDWILWKRTFLHEALDGNLCIEIIKKKLYVDDLDKNKNVTVRKGRKDLASKKECYDKVSAMEKASLVKHKRKLDFLINKIKNKLYLGLESARAKWTNNY